MARVSGRITKPLGPKRGRKLDLVTERSGKPIVGTLTEGQCHASPEAIPLLERATERM